jgi:subfamily B ATP-binding cassette protein MsbA
MINKQETGMTLYKRLLGVTALFWQSMALGILATLLLSASDSLIAWLIKPIVNEGFIDRNNHFIRYLPLILVLIFALRSLASFFSNYLIARVSRQVIMVLRQRVFEHVLKLPMRYFDGHPSAETLSIILYNVEQLSQASSDALVTVLREGTLAIGLLIVMFTISWKLSLFFVLVLPPMMLGLRYASKRLRELARRVQTSVAEVAEQVGEVLEGQRVIRISGAQSVELKKFKRITEQNRQQELKVQVTNSLGTALTQLMMALPLAMILYFATSERFGVSAGSFAAMISALMMMIRPLRRVTELNSFLQKGIAGAASIFKLLDETPEIETGTQSLSQVRGALAFQSVSFTYPGHQQAVLSQINFSVKPGETVAIVGPSGAGKSSLINLIPRFYELSHGKILLDGTDISSLTRENLRAQIAMVSQQTTLFNDSIANNIAYGDPAPDLNRIETAAKQAYAWDFIQQLPAGLNTRVGENGLLLSGGQRQRLAIARALYKRAPVLILDEATSALDSESERAIQAALGNLFGQCTILVIAHRLSTIEHADWILVMEQGRMVAFGKHKDLLADGGLYARLHQIQFSSIVIGV